MTPPVTGGRDGMHMPGGPTPEEVIQNLIEIAYDAEERGDKRTGVWVREAVRMLEGVA